MKKLRITALALSLALFFAPRAAAQVYLDLHSSDWYTPAVHYAVSHGLFNGVADGRFAPGQTMERGMFYTVLSRLAGAETVGQAATNLRDVPAGAWYTGAVIWALGNDIADCQAGGVFGVSAPISRQEICLALWRYDRAFSLGLFPQGQAPDAAFPDLQAADPAAKAAIAACALAGVVNGKADGGFHPGERATRAEAAQIFQRLCQLPGFPAPQVGAGSAAPWNNVTTWSGQLAADFPLSALDHVTAPYVLWLNQRILSENVPAKTAPQGESLDGNPKHLTNYGAAGLSDCVAVTTTLPNKNNDVPAAAALGGRQEYYGYSLQVSGVLRQDRWHQQAQKSGKDPWQCTWWVWGRAAQYLELSQGLDFTACCEGRDNFGHGRDYYQSLSAYFASDQTPTANSIVSWSGGSYGHVAYVEAVDQGGIWVSMADSGHSWRGVTYIARTDSETNPYPLYWYGWEQLCGFNHLDQPKNTP